MKFEDICINHKIIQKGVFTHQEKKDIIIEAMKLSIRKVEHTIDSWQRRNKIQKLSDFLLGDIAKLCFNEYLKCSNISAIDYDKIRTDHFKNPDLFDLKVGDYSIEVKSSLEKSTLHLQDIVYKRRIIDNRNSVHSNNHDIVAQAFFMPINGNALHNAHLYEEQIRNLPYNNMSKSRLCNLILLNFDIYFVGWTDKQTLYRTKESFQVQNNLTGAASRSYGNFFVKDSFNNDQLVHTLKSCISFDTNACA